MSIVNNCKVKIHPIKENASSQENTVMIYEYEYLELKIILIRIFGTKLMSYMSLK